MSPSDAAFDADFYDGRTSARRRVRVSRTAAGIAVLGDGAALEVALGELRFKARVGNLPLRIELPAGAALIADAEAVARVLPVPRATGLAKRLEAHAGMLVVSIAGVAVALALGWLYGLPWLAREAAHLVPASMEADLAERSLRQLDRFVVRPSDLPQARRDEIAVPFAAMAKRAGVDATLEFRHGEWLGPNAFALPGARIVLTDELVDLMGDDRLVLAVLAHELGHVAHRHVTQKLLQSSLVALGTVLLVGDVSGVTGLAAAPTAFVQMRYSRDLERDADRYAFDLLRQTGGTPKDFAAALAKLQAAAEKRRGKERVPDFVSTHPDTEERIRAADGAR